MRSQEENMDTITLTLTLETHGHVFTLDIDDSGTETSVEISQDGKWIGGGRCLAFGLEDCAAILGGGNGENSDAIYEAIDDTLLKAGVWSKRWS